MKVIKKMVIILLFIGFSTSHSLANTGAKIIQERSIKNTVTENEVREAQKQWAQDLITIGKNYKNKEAYEKAATHLINTLYDYQEGDVLFKPTKARQVPFRQTKAGALSYFIGNDKKNFPEDKGFALMPWVNVTFKNTGMFFYGDMAIAMGEYTFTAKKGYKVTVEYTFGYLKDEKGHLRIVLHHSSLPYNP